MESIVKDIRPRLEAMRLSFPTRFTSSRPPATRKAAPPTPGLAPSSFPPTNSQDCRYSLRKLVCHESFHILSRANPELRERLYEAIGFAKCAEIDFPAALRARKITNPDAPRNDHYIRVRVGGKECLAVPILYADRETYDVARGGEFFDYLQFRLLLVERGKGPDSVRVRYDGDKPMLVDVPEAAGFFEQVGRNTGYIIHPEDIIADNFARW